MEGRALRGEWGLGVPSFRSVLPTDSSALPLSLSLLVSEPLPLQGNQWDISAKTARGLGAKLAGAAGHQRQLIGKSDLLRHVAISRPKPSRPSASTCVHFLIRWPHTFFPIY